jgi:membrane associated rhomboid family serine protease
MPHAWIGSLAYTLVLLGVAYLAGIHAFGRDWLGDGALRAGAVRAGSIWRTVTALTLHVDVAHLVANLGFGVVFGYFAGQLLGFGVAWASIVGAAAVANLLTSLIAPAEHSSVGASTAVFVTLGLLAAHGWRLRHALQERWAYRYAPLVAGVAMLAFLGVGDARTDVLAHLSGFVVGAVLGWWQARPGRTRITSGTAQAAAGVATIALVVVAWFLAMLT